MPDKPTTVNQYLAAQTPETRKALQAVRQVILKNLDKGFEEGIQYGAIGYYVPHRLYPEGYYCDPSQPLPWGGIAARKGYMTLGFMGLHWHPDGDGWFRQAWKKTGKKLDMGVACIRFKEVEDLPLDLIGKTVKKLTVKKFIADYLTATEGQRTRTSAKKASKRK